MKHSFPRWFAYLLSGAISVAFGACVMVVLGSGKHHGPSDYLGLGLLGAAACALLVWSYLYATRYGIQVIPEGVSITGAFRTRTIPLSAIAQVITASAPRAGTDSWLVGKGDTCLAKLDGGVIGFEELLIELGHALRPYQALFYRRGDFGAWRMQVAGDLHWVPYEAPRFVRRSGR